MLAIKLGFGLKKIRLAPAARRVSRGRILGHREGGVCVSVTRIGNLNSVPHFRNRFGIGIRIGNKCSKEHGTEEAFLPLTQQPRV